MNFIPSSTNLPLQIRNIMIASSNNEVQYFTIISIQHSSTSCIPLFICCLWGLDCILVLLCCAWLSQDSEDILVGSVLPKEFHWIMYYIHTRLTIINRSNVFRSPLRTDGWLIFLLSCFHFIISFCLLLEHWVSWNSWK